MDLLQYRKNEAEQNRTKDLLKKIPKNGQSVLDVGARDGYFSILLAEHFDAVTALDLEKPTISHKKVTCIKGDITNLDLEDNSFDLVFCAEVLEHIPTHLLGMACSELSRVTKCHLLLGVPYKQDIRVGRTTCYSCGRKNPPWGHVNVFDEKLLWRLFPGFNLEKMSFVGKTNLSTNIVSRVLMDLAGNPYGTYSQEEPCVYCGKKLINPTERNIFQKVISRIAFWMRNTTMLFKKSHPNWVHVLLRKS